MTKEQIQLAAEDARRALAESLTTRGIHHYIDDVSFFIGKLSYDKIAEAAFVKGAEWRINSVWHDVSERPDERRAVIIEYGENRISLREKGYDAPWKYNVEQFGFKRWAYIKDLLP